MSNSRHPLRRCGGDDDGMKRMATVWMDVGRSRLLVSSDQGAGSGGTGGECDGGGS